MCLLKEESSQARIAPTKHQEVTLTLLRFPSPPIPSPPAVPRGTQGNMNCQRWLYWLWGGMTTAEVGLPYFCALLVVIQSQPLSSSPSQILVLAISSCSLLSCPRFFLLSSSPTLSLSFLCSPCWSGNWNRSAKASRVLELRACATMPSLVYVTVTHFKILDYKHSDLVCTPVLLSCPLQG